jgi:hypothetical protein
MNPQYIVVRDQKGLPTGVHACKPCNNIMKELGRYGYQADQIDRIGRAVCLESRKTPSGTAKTFKNSLRDIGKLFPEELPLLAAKGVTWAKDMLEGKKPEKRVTGAALCSAAVRKELKEKFPKVKVRVTSSNFSMGDSVTVYVIGQERDVVDRIRDVADKYQEGHFDGMTDMYEYSNRIEGLPQAKYVFVESRNS